MNLRERAVYNAALAIWERTGFPVSAEAVAEATGFDLDTTRNILATLHAKGYFRDAVCGDDTVHAVAF